MIQTFDSLDIRIPKCKSLYVKKKKFCRRVKTSSCKAYKTYRDKSNILGY